MPAGTPDADAVRAQLERILASPGFANAGRLSRFLRFVVERTLDGEGDQLKEYRLGTEVFDRPADYDPRLDSIVRVEARRLRAKLAEYYAGPGQGDPVLIGMDKGSYSARFETAAAGDTPAEEQRVAGELVERVIGRPTTARWLAPVLGGLIILAVLVVGWRLVARDTASASSRVQVAVLPLTRYDPSPEPVPEALADAVTDGLIAELARHSNVEVASRTSVMPYRERHVPLSTVAATLNVQAVVEGRIQVTGSRLWVEVRLVDAKRDRKLWVDDFTGTTSDRRELERRVAAALAKVLTERFAAVVE
jgi:TolB-like protein